MQINKIDMDQAKTNLNTTTSGDTQSIRGIDNSYSPLSVFVIISFVCIVWIIIYKSVIDKFPTLFTLCVLTMYTVLACALLIIIGRVSVTMEWTCVVILTLFLLMSTFTITYPEVLFYPELS